MSDGKLTARSKSILVICFGVFQLIGVVVQIAFGRVLIPVKHSPRTFMSLGDGWGTLLCEVLLGAALVWKGVKGVQTDTWPPF